MRIGPAEGLFFNQMNEEILSEVLGVLSAIAVAPDKRIHGTGIAPVECLKSAAPLFVIAGGRHQAPLGRLECEAPARA